MAIDNEKTQRATEEKTSTASSFLPPPPKGKTEDEYPKNYDYSSRRSRNASLGDEFDWRTKLRTDLITAAERWAETLGVSKFSIESQIRDNWDRLVQYVQPDTVTRSISGDGDVLKVDPQPNEALSKQQWEHVWNKALGFMSVALGVDLIGVNSAGGRGGGSRPPTEQEIRNQFDMDELTDGVENFWRAYLVEEPQRARGIAEDYVDAIVAGRGETTIDFKTFVLGQMEKTSRWATIYRNKPEGVDPLQYVQPFVQAATSVMGGGAGNTKAVSDVAVGGAALGASPDAFRSRVARTDEHTASTGFITGLENRVRDIKNVLRD